ncbi:probable CKS1-cyclin-dependent kinases regulatory subunit [Serendipita indica DSM 11827]|uniref:Cyclin-dependent kinases regulatory subunit n=1 Tax=Serendipita indica (strain DSM 11827) TaxID=1109443 RepID=G4TUV8_SERID|nr:probable CKS1-cyclin-dependent kinases regulatory subunit [Serendipita indica DSM 11827]
MEAKLKQQQQQQKFQEYVERIHYSDRYSDDFYEYRHVILPKPLLKMVPRAYFSDTTPGVLRLLTEEEWRNIGITQSPGWVHYEVHAPEPHVLLFRRELQQQ